MLGKPIGHSLSPVLHRAAYRALGLSGWTYRAIECDAAGLAALLAGSGPEVAGYSCTMPLKRAVLREAVEASPVATAIGAANTLLPVPGGWFADNTDWLGVRDALAAQRVAATGQIVLLGAGGTAQAALAALGEAASITALVREPSRAGPLIETAERLGRPLRIGRLSEPASVAEADLVISTLPAAAADPLAAQGWQRGRALLDAVYHPWPTMLAEQAAASGAQVVSGAAMLLFQAARQVELMTGRAAPVEAMRAALLAAVPGCGA